MSYPLGALLRDRLGLAVAVANNAHVVALGEHAFGCAHGMKDFIVITLGSGMGSCIFSNGAVNLGYEGFAGEVGHTCVHHERAHCAAVATRDVWRPILQQRASCRPPGK